MFLIFREKQAWKRFTLYCSTKNYKWCPLRHIKLSHVCYKFQFVVYDIHFTYLLHEAVSLRSSHILWTLRIHYCVYKSSPHTHIYRVSQEECARLRESVPYVKVYRCNPKHLYPKLNGYGDNGQRKVGASCGSKYCNLHS